MTLQLQVLGSCDNLFASELLACHCAVQYKWTVCCRKKEGLAASTASLALDMC